MRRNFACCTHAIVCFIMCFCAPLCKQCPKVGSLCVRSACSSFELVLCLCQLCATIGCLILGAKTSSYYFCVNCVWETSDCRLCLAAVFCIQLKPFLLAMQHKVRRVTPFRTSFQALQSSTSSPMESLCLAMLYRCSLALPSPLARLPCVLP